MIVRRRDRLIASFACVGILVLFLTACVGSSGSPDVEATNRAGTEQAISDEGMDADEHQDADEHVDADEPMDEAMSVEHAHVEAPAEFEGLTNPVAGDPDAIAEGARIFAITCVICHGEAGMGDGPISVTLDPKPAALGDRQMMAEVSDGYLFWRISEGGAMEPFNSGMASWKSLGEEKIWQLISFIRTLGG